MSIVDTPPPASALGLDVANANANANGEHENVTGTENGTVDAVTAQVLEDLQDAIAGHVNDAGATEDGDDEAEPEGETENDAETEGQDDNDDAEGEGEEHANGGEGEHEHEHDDTTPPAASAKPAATNDAHGPTPRKDRGEDKENGVKTKTEGGVRKVLKSGVFGGTSDTGRGVRVCPHCEQRFILLEKDAI